MKYRVIFEKGQESWGANVPDLPECGVAGERKDEVEQLIKEAMRFHIEGLEKAGENVPEPSYFASVISV